MGSLQFRLYLSNVYTLLRTTPTAMVRETLALHVLRAEAVHFPRLAEFAARATSPRFFTSVVHEAIVAGVKRSAIYRKKRWVNGPTLQNSAHSKRCTHDNNVLTPSQPMLLIKGFGWTIRIGQQVEILHSLRAQMLD